MVRYFIALLLFAASFAVDFSSVSRFLDETCSEVCGSFSAFASGRSVKDGTREVPIGGGDVYCPPGKGC